MKAKITESLIKVYYCFGVRHITITYTCAFINKITTVLNIIDWTLLNNLI
jgi:hypothetical protein